MCHSMRNKLFIFFLNTRTFNKKWVPVYISNMEYHIKKLILLIKRKIRRLHMTNKNDLVIQTFLSIKDTVHYMHSVSCLSLFCMCQWSEVWELNWTACGHWGVEEAQVSFESNLQVICTICIPIANVCKTSFH